MKQLDVSIIFVYYNTPKEIIDAVDSVKEAVGKFSYQIIIIDNDSPNKPPAKLFSKKNLEYYRSENLGYGEGLNKGARIAKGRYLLLSNPDLIYKKNSISIMIEKMDADSSIGIIGPAFLDQKERIRKVGSDMPFIPQALFALSSINKLFPNNYFSRKYFIRDFDRKSERVIPVLCGASMLTRSGVFKKIKGFDKRFFMYFEEADICYRINKLGFKVLYFPKSQVIHCVGRSSNDLKFIEKTFEHSRLEFLKKYHGVLLGTITESIIRAINQPSKIT